ncbi:MAG: hypothetical protein KME35_23230 [Aphanocapsa sp. GSE-SYN-MK-11-07L]|jgi:hypothetical protein|nr:hypothetical protein [Aphanocapsa sp. GSE-SYN-MK-11-07L]
MTSTIDNQDWQQDFVATNLLAIGSNAWRGYSTGERGIVVCSLNNPAVGVVGESFKAYFIPRSRLAAFLNAWLAAPDTVILQYHHMNSHILHAVDTYNPTKDAILLLESGHYASFIYLRNLPITPIQCYECICKEWTEFQPQSCLDKEKLRHT